MGLLSDITWIDYDVGFVLGFLVSSSRSFWFRFMMG